MARLKITLCLRIDFSDVFCSFCTCLMLQFIAFTYPQQYYEIYSADATKSAQAQLQLGVHDSRS